MKFKEMLKKFWNLFWKDDSIWGWVFSLIILFLFIKLLFFPVLRLSTGTELPLAIVESCSMYHKWNPFYTFDDWWKDHEAKYSAVGLTKEDFEEFKVKNGFNKGDILFMIGTTPEKLKIGDVITFEGNQANPIIHRIISIKKEDGELVFSTMGDNNNGQLTVEKNIKASQIKGKTVIRLVPFLGWGRLIFYEFQRSPSERGFCNQN
jgi:hypothetical protein